MMQPGKRLSAMLGLATGMILAMGVWSPYVTAPLPAGNGTDVTTGSPPAPLAPPLRIANIGNLTLQGVIVGNTKNPGMAMLGEPGAPPVMVPEGAKVGSDILLERVLPDRVILRQEGVDTPVVLYMALSPTAGPSSDIPAPPQSGSTGETWTREDLPQPPPGSAPPISRELLPRDRVPAPIDASGPEPGAGLTGPALPGPTAQ